MNKWNREEPVAVAKPAKGIVDAKAPVIVLLRRKELGNNCGFIADAYPGMKIVQPNEVPARVDWIVRWGTTTPIADRDAKVINKATAITETSNKGEFRLKANKAGLTPRTWGTLNDLGKEDAPPEAVIIRARHHERSENINLCRNLNEAEAAIKKCKGDYYISEYIQKDEEYRVFVAQGRAFMVFRKRPKDRKAVSWGCVEEGALEYVRWSEWPPAVVENAIKAFNLSSLDFGAVDVIVKNNKAYFLEINTAPEVWPYYGERFADIFSYMVKNERKRIPVKNYKEWKYTIHPALSDKAA